MLNNTTEPVITGHKDIIFPDMSKYVSYPGWKDRGKEAVNTPKYCEENDFFLLFEAANHPL